MRNNIIERLEEVLANERQAILTGNYALLKQLAEVKEALLAALPRAKPSQSALRSIKTQMNETQSLTEAAMRGVAEARRRIEEIEMVRDRLKTYDQSGQLEVVSKPGVQLEIKA